MTLEFTVEQKENGMLLRDFLRKRGVSAALAKGVKASDGFFRDGAPVHTDMRLSAGQRISFALPPEPPTGNAFIGDFRWLGLEGVSLTEGYTDDASIPKERTKANNRKAPT